MLARFALSGSRSHPPSKKILNPPMCFRTEAESFGIAGLEDEGEDGHDREEAAGQDQVDDVVERLAAQSERERDARVRNVATVIPDLRLFRRHLYIHNTTVRL